MKKKEKKAVELINKSLFPVFISVRFIGMGLNFMVSLAGVVDDKLVIIDN